MFTGYFFNLRVTFLDWYDAWWAILGVLGTILGCLRGLLGAILGVLRGSGELLGRSRIHFGAPRVHLGALGPILGSRRSPQRPLNRGRCVSLGARWAKWKPLGSIQDGPRDWPVHQETFKRLVEIHSPGGAPPLLGGRKAPKMAPGRPETPKTPPRIIPKTCRGHPPLGMRLKNFPFFNFSLFFCHSCWCDIKISTRWYSWHPQRWFECCFSLWLSRSTPHTKALKST